MNMDHGFDGVLFVRGSGRCGSKNLVRMLGSHPDCAHVPVNQVLPEELIDWSRFRLKTDDSRITDTAVTAGCRGYFAGYGRAMAGPGRILLHKNTMNAHHLGTLLDFWPEARLVYLVRHPVGWVEALLNADIHDYAGLYGYEATVADTLLRWCTELKTYLASPAFNHPRVMQIRFEDLVADPDAMAKRVCRFAELSEARLEPYGQPERFPQPFVLTPDERAWVCEMTADVTRALGYPADHEPQSAVLEANSADPNDHPNRRLRHRPPTADGLELLNRAVAEAVCDGHNRIALFGGGYFTRLIMARADQLSPHVVAVLDDNPLLHAATLGGRPVQPPARAEALDIDAVIPATFVHQEKLLNRWSKLTADSIPAYPLWSKDPRVCERGASCAAV